MFCGLERVNLGKAPTTEPGIQAVPLSCSLHTHPCPPSLFSLMHHPTPTSQKRTAGCWRANFSSPGWEKSICWRPYSIQMIDLGAPRGHPVQPFLLEMGRLRLQMEPQMGDSPGINADHRFPDPTSGHPEVDPTSPLFLNRGLVHRTMVTVIVLICRKAECAGPPDKFGCCMGLCHAAREVAFPTSEE